MPKKSQTVRSDHLPPIREFADRGVQWLLSRPQNLRGLLTILAPDPAEAVDSTRARTVPTTFIPEDLRKADCFLHRATALDARPQCGVVDGLAAVAAAIYAAL